MITRSTGYGWGTKRSAISFEKSLAPTAPLPTRLAFTERLDEFFQDFAVAATWTPSTGGAQQSAWVILDAPDELLLAGQYTGILSTEYLITLEAAYFPGLKTNEALRVDAVNYKVREVRLVDDGKIKQVSLSKV